MWFAAEHIMDITAIALPGQGPDMLTNSNSSQGQALAPEDMTEQQPTSAAGGDAVTNENNQERLDRLDRLETSMASLQQEIQLREQLLSRTPGSALQQQIQQPDLSQLQTGSRPQQLQVL